MPTIIKNENIEHDFEDAFCELIHRVNTLTGLLQGHAAQSCFDDARDVRNAEFCLVEILGENVTALKNRYHKYVDLGIQQPEMNGE